MGICLCKRLAVHCQIRSCSHQQRVSSWPGCGKPQQLSQGHLAPAFLKLSVRLLHQRPCQWLLARYLCVFWATSAFSQTFATSEGVVCFPSIQHTWLVVYRALWSPN